MSQTESKQALRLFSIALLAGDALNSEVVDAHTKLSSIARNNAEHFEIVIVRTPRKGSPSDATTTLRDRLKNSIFIELPSRVSRSSAAVIALQQAIGDHVLVLELEPGQIHAAEKLISKVSDQVEVVFGNTSKASRKRQGWKYRLGQRVFGLVFSAIHGTNISLEAPVFRAMSRSSVNAILAARRPEVEFRAFIITGAFGSTTVDYESEDNPKSAPFWESYGSAMQMLLGGTKVPMRFASLLSLLGAVLNIFYAIYVLAIAILGQDIQNGWASTSLQISAMFFLVCLVLFLISEYLLQLLPDREHSYTTFSTSFDGDQLVVGKSPNVTKPQSGNA
jgi:hypothetical protein